MTYRQTFDHLGNRRKNYRQGPAHRHYLAVLRRWLLVVLGIAAWAALTAALDAKVLP
jgi:hypothetical protein